MFYSRRRKVIKEIRRRVEDGRAKDEREEERTVEVGRGGRYPRRQPASQTTKPRLQRGGGGGGGTGIDLDLDAAGSTQNPGTHTGAGGVDAAPTYIEQLNGPFYHLTPRPANAAPR
jgi:hypothetical protein